MYHGKNTCKCAGILSTVKCQYVYSDAEIYQAEEGHCESSDKSSKVPTMAVFSTQYLSVMAKMNLVAVGLQQHRNRRNAFVEHRWHHDTRAGVIHRKF